MASQEPFIVHTDPQLAAAEYIQAAYNVPLSDLQKREITRAFAAGMLQATTVWHASLSNLPADIGHKVVETMTDQLTAFGEQTIKERYTEKQAKIQAQKN